MLRNGDVMRVRSFSANGLVAGGYLVGEEGEDPFGSWVISFAYGSNYWVNGLG